MKNFFTGILTLSLILGVNLASSGWTPASENISSHLKITIRILNYAQVPRATLAGAEEEAARILREAGVETLWIDCTPSGQVARLDSSCYESPGPKHLMLRIHPKFVKVEGALRDGTLGFALLSTDGRRSAYASVFYDYAEDLSRHSMASRSQILGHAIAHELGHLLLSTDGHSPRGLMQARWDRADLQRAAQGLLLFTSDEAGLMRAEVLARSAEQERIWSLARAK